MWVTNCVRRTTQGEIRAALLALLVVLTLAGCEPGTGGGSGPAHAQADSTSPAPSPTLGPQTTETATAAPPADPRTFCPASGGARLTIASVVPNPAAREGVRLPDDLAQKPQVSTPSLATGQISLDNGTVRGYAFDTPPAGQAGIVCGVTVRIVSYQPLSGPVPNVTLPCVDQTYLDPGGWEPSTACPGLASPAGAGAVHLSSAATGTAAVATIWDPRTAPLQPGQIPSREGANAWQVLMLGITVPLAGTYTFGVGFWQDQSGPSIASPTISETFTLGQYAHEWGGDQCTTAAMQSQLPPPGNPPLAVICPGAPHPAPFPTVANW